MKPKSRAFRPGLAGLEPRALMSVAEIAPLVASSVVIAGKIQSKYQAGLDARAADAPLRVKLTGAGKVQGPVKMAGTLDFGGLRLPLAPDVTGTVRLSNAKGSITLALSGAGGSIVIPRSRVVLDATIVGGTGIYASLQGSGTATAVFAKSTLKAKTLTAPIAGNATFTLNLNATIG